jgi:hypothetical protein
MVKKNSKLTAKQFIDRIKKHVIIQEVNASNFYYYVNNSDKYWMAAFVPSLNRIYLKGKQPNLFKMHEIIHFYRAHKDLLDVNHLYREEIIAYLGGYLLGKRLGCKLDIQNYNDAWNKWLTVSNRYINYPEVYLAAHEAVDGLMKLVSSSTK